MLFIISDASVLIDIEHGKLSREMFSLPWKFAVPDILFEEELAERHLHLLDLGLVTKSMSSELIAKAYELYQQYAKPSVNDMLALTLAKHEGYCLLTGDKALREVAKKLVVSVHGTIWLVGQMLQNKKITIEVAGMAFQRMKDSGSRLPWGEIEKLLKELNITRKRSQKKRQVVYDPI